MLPNTRTLDHIVHLTPPGTVEHTSKQFQQLGFRFVGLLILLNADKLVELSSNTEFYQAVLTQVD